MKRSSSTGNHLSSWGRSDLGSGGEWKQGSRFGLRGILVSSPCCVSTYRRQALKPNFRVHLILAGRVGYSEKFKRSVCFVSAISWYSYAVIMMRLMVIPFDPLSR